MKRVRYKVYLTTGAILTTEGLAKDASLGLSEVCTSMMEGMWYIWLVDGVKVCINSIQVTHVTAEEIGE